MSAAEPARVVVVEFRPVLRVELAPVVGVGDEEVVATAIAAWTRALAGADRTGRPAEADWWGAAPVVDVAQLVGLQMVGARWAVLDAVLSEAR